MERIKNIVIAVLVALLVSSLFLNVRYCTRGGNPSLISDTVIVTIIDTISYYQPTPTKENAVSNIAAKLPIARSEENFGKTPKSGCARQSRSELRSALACTLFPHIEKADSVEVVVPITQKIYKDSTYTAYVSGYNPNLDSLFIYPRHDVMTITKTVKAKRKRWSIGLQVGCGVNLKGKPEPTPYIGVGISYNLFNF